MMVASSFDLWKKDAFFSAAEEVQESADALESAYRVWLREKRGGSPREDMVELSRDLQTALGTAKWQLEEFDRAVTLSYRSCSEESTKIRHKQFVLALETQISRVETALGEYLNHGSMEPLRWIHLDEEERADLAMFLGGTSKSSPAYTTKVLADEEVELVELETSKRVSSYCVRDADIITRSSRSNGPYESVPRDFNIIAFDNFRKDKSEAEENEICAGTDAVTHESERISSTTKVWSSSDFVTLDMSNATEDSSDTGPTQKPVNKELATSIFSKQWCRDHSQRRIIFSNIRWRGASLIKQIFQRAGMIQRRARSPQRCLITCFFQLVLLLLLTVFLVVPYVAYSA